VFPLDKDLHGGRLSGNQDAFLSISELPVIRNPYEGVVTGEALSFLRTGAF
jgi:hypothetical protein